MDVKKLHTKFVKGQTTKEEKKILFDHVREKIFQGVGDLDLDDDFISQFLMTSHEDYGKPDDKGHVIIV